MSVKLLVVAMALGGCASTRAMLEKPVSGHCESNGLRDCTTITDGVITYVEGDQRLAYQKLHVAMAASEPDDVIAFAGALKAMAELPSRAQHAKAIEEIADLLARDGKEAASRLDTKEPKEATRPTTSKRKIEAPTLDHPAADTPVKGKSSPAPPMGVPVMAQIEGRTVVPATDEGNRACLLSGIMSPSAESSRGYCVRVARGPLVVTDVHSSSACPAELFAIAVVPGDLSTPRWAVYGQPSYAINVSSGALAVRENEQFVIGVMSSSDQKMKRDIRCAVTWSGWRPTAKADGD
jgi:hypothetical protein